MRNFSAICILWLFHDGLAFQAKLPHITSKKDYVLKSSYDNDIGSLPPLGFWDPLGIVESGDQKNFNRLREVEIKHGRISMLAIVGHMVTSAGYRLPGFIAFDTPFSSIKAGLAAFEGIPELGTIQIILFIGLLELEFRSIKIEVEASCTKTMIILGWDEKKRSHKRAIELNNGRAAQMGILALMVHEKLNNDPYMINSLLGFPVLFNR